MCDQSIVLIGDCFFTKLFDEFKHNDYRLDDRLPIVVAGQGARISLLTDLERFLAGRSLLIVHLGCWEVSKSWNLASAVDELAKCFGRLKTSNPDLEIVVFQLSQRGLDAREHCDPYRCAQYNHHVDVFNERLRQMPSEIVTVSKSVLDGLTDVLDEFGWSPNDKGVSRIADAVSKLIRQHRGRLPDPRPEYVPPEYSCDTLIVGDRMFFGVSRHIRASGVDAVVATAWNAQAYMLSSISHLVGSCRLKKCIIYLGASDIKELGVRLNHRVDRTIAKLNSAVRCLKRNNPQCRIVICTLQTPPDVTAQHGGNAKAGRHVGLPEYQQKISEFNRLLHNYDWEVHDLGLPFARPYSNAVARRLLAIVRYSNSERRCYPAPSAELFDPYNAGWVYSMQAALVQSGQI